MSANDESSNALNDDIIRLFLYGTEDARSTYAHEALIRPTDASTEYHVDALTFKDGPGRFAVPELFELVRLFFDASLSELNAVTGRSPDANGEITLSKNEIIDYYNIALYGGKGNFGLSFNQAVFDDEKDNYFQRVFIWASSSFKINDDANFLVNVNTGEKRIDNFSVVNASDPPKDDFNFSGGTFTNAFRLIAKPRTDPFGMGRTVDIFLDNQNNIPTWTYLESEYRAHLDDPMRKAARMTISGVDNAGPVTVNSGVESGVLKSADGITSPDQLAAVSKLATSYGDYFRRLYGEDVIVFREDGYDIYYGTNYDDGPLESLKRFLENVNTPAGETYDESAVLWRLMVPVLDGNAETSPEKEIAAAQALGEAVEAVRSGSILKAFANSIKLLAIGRNVALNSLLGAPHLSYVNEAKGVAEKGAIIFAGAGDDVAVGNLDKDNKIFGGSGDDFLIGGRAFDEIDGGEGIDRVIDLGGESGSITAGGLGRDWIWNTSDGGIIWGDIENSYSIGKGLTIGTALLADGSIAKDYVHMGVVDGVEKPQSVRVVDTSYVDENGITQSAQQIIADDASNADNIWFWADKPSGADYSRLNYPVNWHSRPRELIASAMGG